MPHRGHLHPTTPKVPPPHTFSWPFLLTSLIQFSTHFPSHSLIQVVRVREVLQGAKGRRVWEVSHLWSKAQQGGEKAREVVHGDVPEECRKLGCVPEQVPQNSHGQLHRGGRVLRLKSNNTPCFQPHLCGNQEEEEQQIGQHRAFEKHDS